MSTPTKAIAELVHADKKREAAQIVIDEFKLPIKLRDDDPRKYNPILLNYLHVLLDKGRPEEAASMLWTETAFSFRPQYTRDVWKLYETTSQGLIMGAGSCSKSFGMGVRLFLEWIRDPEWTSIKVLGPSQDHLEANLFSHLVSLHNSAALPMPGEVGELFIGMDRRDQLSAIKGVVIPIGQVKKAGRLQGSKRKPRPKPHPTFGALSRMFIFVDEGENVPGGLWKDVDNILSNIQETGSSASSGFKIFMAYNPTNREAEIGKRSEPPFGWDMFDPEKHYRWKSTRGWDVLRLDGERSENVIHNKMIFPGLQTREGLEAIALNSGGRNSPGYHSMGRGMYPPTGIELSIIPPGALSKWRGEFIWLDNPLQVGSTDLALEGNASAKYTLGRWGLATGIKYPPSLEHPQGRIVMFKDRNGMVVPRWGLQADTQLLLPKGDTVKMSDSVIDVSKRSAVRPEYYACDRTGNGSGVADLVKNNWSPAIHDVNFSQGCPEKKKIMAEDTKTCEEEYDRINSVLWYLMARWGEFGYLLLAPTLDMTKLTTQLTNRKSRTFGKVKRVESKKDYISRGYESPDDADSLSLLVYAAWMGSGITLSMTGDYDRGAEGADGWEDERAMHGGAYISSENMNEALDREDQHREEAIL